MKNRFFMVLFFLMVNLSDAGNASAYYHTQLGRFIARDPIGYEGSKGNLYGYAGNAPSQAVDPEGMRSIFPVQIPNQFPVQTDHKACDTYRDNLQKKIDRETDKEKKKDLLEMMNRPTVLCFNGKPITCVFPKTFPAEGRPIENDVAYRIKTFCRRSHEQYHADNHMASCQGVPNCEPASFKTDDLKINSMYECVAYRGEIQCLANALQQSGEGAWCKNQPECLKRIQREIEKLIRNGERDYGCTDNKLPLKWPPGVPKRSG